MMKWSLTADEARRVKEMVNEDLSWHLDDPNYVKQATLHGIMCKVKGIDMDTKKAELASLRQEMETYESGGPWVDLNGVKVSAITDEQRKRLMRLTKAKIAAAEDTLNILTVPMTMVGSMYDGETYSNATFAKINRELDEMVQRERVLYNDARVEECLATIKECYGLDDEGCMCILAFLCQIRARIAKFAEVGDIRKIKGYNSFGIMLALYGGQGIGKSVFAEILQETIGGTQHQIDELMGDWGTLDVFYKPMIVMNEFGRQKKENLDVLKSYVTGETVTVNQKYKEPVNARAFASLLLTSNFDPTMLKGTELGSRRILVVRFTHAPTCSVDEIRDAVKKLWSVCTPKTYDQFWGTSIEALAKGNFVKQAEEEIDEFVATLTDEEYEWLSRSCDSDGRRHTRKRIKMYLKECGYDYAPTRVDMFLNDSSVFELVSGSKDKSYKLVRTRSPQSDEGLEF